MATMPLYVQDAARWYAASVLALGLRTGLVAALLDGGTAPDLAARAAVDPQNARAWADAMVAAGYARLADGVYAPVEDAIGGLRGEMEGFQAVVSCLVPMGALLPSTERAIRDGRGISSTEVQTTLGTLPELVNAPMYRTSLVDDWIAGHPELEARLRAGIDAAEIGPGGGQALRVLAAAFPASRFIGFDIDADQVARAGDAATAAGLTNLRFEVRDAARLLPGTLDLIAVFDAFHHFGDPAAVIAAARGALRPGGALLIAEPGITGDPSVDVPDPTDPMGILMYGSDFIYCFQESKADGGVGLGAAWSGRELRGFLTEHGFHIVAETATDDGYALIRAEPVARG